ncbi:hypothetical protein ACH4C6_29095 [Streptomyces sp. NPDC017943]|uniref:hypothetical protein n=1 Tax=Streptomyces sp. NPDC017943 TaxID=3365019 RepID=UPI0037A816DB
MAALRVVQLRRAADTHTALRWTQSTEVAICLLLLRLPVGALAAVFGLLVIQGGFVPGLTDLDSGAQILAWALMFGIAQETVTRLVDQQSKRVLGNVRGPSRGLRDEDEPDER